MSIRDEINRNLRSELVRLRPSLASIPIKRVVVLSRELNELLDGPWPDDVAEMAFGRLRNDLESFIAGSVVSVAQTPRRAKTAFLNRLEKERGQFWEMRQRIPKPGIRILGGFSEKDVFVGLTWSPRVLLKGYGSRDWRDATEECKVRWRRLFLSWPPFGGERVQFHEYVSNIILI